LILLDNGYLVSDRISDMDIGCTLSVCRTPIIGLMYHTESPIWQPTSMRVRGTVNSQQLGIDG